MRLFSRFRPRISLRMSLCLFPIVGIAFGWLGRHVTEHRAEQRHVAAINDSAPFFGDPSTFLLPNQTLLPVFL